jgi:hypothetical protein
MKHTLIIATVLIMCALKPATVNGQPAKTVKEPVKNLGGQYCDAYEAPLMLRKGSLVKIECDTAYVVNSHRYDLYERARQALLGMNLELYRELPQASTNWNKESELAYNALLYKYRELDSLCTLQLNDNHNMLSSVRDDLNNAQASLGSALLELGQAREAIKSEKRSNNRSKILWGLGGFGLGILSGVLISG